MLVDKEQADVCFVYIQVEVTINSSSYDEDI